MFRVSLTSRKILPTSCVTFLSAMAMDFCKTTKKLKPEVWVILEPRNDGDWLINEKWP